MLRFYRNDGKCINPVSSVPRGTIRTKREEKPKEEIKEEPIVKRGRKKKEVK